MPAACESGRAVASPPAECMSVEKGGRPMTLWWHWLTAQTRARGWASGQGLVEYALILIFVAVALIALLTILGPCLKPIYQDIDDQLNTRYKAVRSRN